MLQVINQDLQMTNLDIGRVLAQINTELQTCQNTWAISSLRFLSSGLEFVVCRARSERFGMVVIKSPWERWIHNDNDSNIDARELLEQEALLLSHARNHDLPAPEMLALHFGARCDFLITSFVETDNSSPSPRQMGELLNRLHRLAPPAFTPVAQRGARLPEVLSERMLRRANVVSRISGTQIEMPSRPALLRLIAQVDRKDCLLHMDFRAANLLVRERDIKGIIDWSNALVGDPSFELARIAEYGHLDSDFVAGYGTQFPLAFLPRRVELAYRLDAAVMLAVVFLSESPNRERARIQIKRVGDLSAELCNEFC